MMYFAVIPSQSVSFLYQKSHSVHSIYEGFDISLLDKFRYVKSRCVIIDNGDTYNIGKWVGICEILRFEVYIIESNVWMDYFGLYPKQPNLMDEHWMNVVKYRYPMLPVKKDNYEAVLAACYLHDKHENESVGAFV